MYNLFLSDIYVISMCEKQPQVDLLANTRVKKLYNNGRYHVRKQPQVNLLANTSVKKLYNKGRYHVRKLYGKIK